MEKRLILAIAFSMLILVIWSAMVPKPPAPKISVPQESLATPKPTVINNGLEPEETSLPTVSYLQKNFEVIFVAPRAAIKEIIFKPYLSHRFTLKNGYGLTDKSLVFTPENITSQGIDFVYKDKTKEIKKEFIFHNSNYSIDLNISIRNVSSSPLIIDYPLILGSVDFKSDPVEARFKDIVVASEGKTLRIAANKDAKYVQTEYVGLRDRYFCNIVQTDFDNATVLIRKANDKEAEVILNMDKSTLNPGAVLQHKFRIYLGPQDLKIIRSANSAWVGIINYGFFDLISQILLQLLGLFYNAVHNWGVAIIILSIAIYFLLFPLSLKQMRSMKEMQALQPRIEALKKTYKDNPQKMHKETLALYKEHKVNPLGGCLPLLLQMPVFFALYQALMRSVALKGANFLWIKDLSEPDRLIVFSRSLPLIGNAFNVLPILMAIIMFLQQKFSMAATNSEYAEQQKMMLIIMPIMFGFIFYQMPSGLVLYWMVNSLLMAIFQVRTNKAK